MLYQNPAIRSRVEVYLVEEAKGGPSKLLLSFLLWCYLCIVTIVLTLNPFIDCFYTLPFESIASYFNNSNKMEK
jgi:hypothetical protein